MDSPCVGRAHGLIRMLSVGERLKGCAARTDKPAAALDPLALTQRRVGMPFRPRSVRRQEVTCQFCAQTDILTLRRQAPRPAKGKIPAEK